MDFKDLEERKKVKMYEEMKKGKGKEVGKVVI